MFQELGYHAGDLPEREPSRSGDVALPIYPELTREMQREVVGAIAEFLRLRN
jgi:dTDP-4-amino-4,6-dideoxygalactose transaminase